jgi:hypothetical protein
MRGAAVDRPPAAQRLDGGVPEAADVVVIPLAAVVRELCRSA